MSQTRTEQAAGGTLAARRLAVLLQPTAAVDRPAYQHLAATIQTLILEGRIALHARMPPERELAPALQMSRTTVSAAYGLLRDSGYLHSRRGAGTWTALPGPAGDSRLLPPPDTSIDLTTAAFGLPQHALSQAFAQTAPRLAEFARTPGYYPFGLAELRAAVAERYTRRGLPTRIDQILITSGAQQALTLTLGLLCGPGDRVLVENPSYPNALDAIRRARLRTAPVPVTGTGWNLDVLDSTLRQVVPRLAYLIPDFHNPVGCLMPAEQRAHALDATRRSGTWLVVDETLTDLALDAAVSPPLASLAAPGQDDHVITIGSLSKSHWAGLRIGWLRASPSLVAELAGVRVSMDVAGSVVDQLLAVSLLQSTDGWLATRLGQVREQRTALAEALGRYTPQWTWRQPTGGLALWVDLGQPIASALADRSVEHGVRIESGARFGAEPGTFEHRLRIPYALPPDTLHEAVRRLAATLDNGAVLTAAGARPHWVA